MSAADPAGPLRVTRDDGRERLVKALAAVVGAFFLIIGIAGFLVTGLDDFAAETDKTLLGFELNPLHNIVHLVIGVLGLVMASRLRTARTFGWILAIVYGATFAYGLISQHEPDINVLSINSADNWLHLASAAVGLLIALLPVHRGRPAGSALADEESAGRRMAG